MSLNRTHTLPYSPGLQAGVSGVSGVSGISGVSGVSDTPSWISFNIQSTFPVDRSETASSFKGEAVAVKKSKIA